MWGVWPVQEANLQGNEACGTQQAGRAAWDTEGM